MDDDLGTPAAVAVIHDHVREGNRLLAAGESAAASRSTCGPRMLDVLGLDPARPGLGLAAAAPDDARLTAAVDALVAGLLDGARRARGPTRTGRGPTRSATGSRPPASPSRTPPTARSGRWPSPGKVTPDAGQQPAQGRDPQVLEAADGGLGRPRTPRARGPRPDPEGRRSAEPQGLQGEGEVRARGRPVARRSGRSTATSGSPGATRWSRRCGPAYPVTGVYVAEGTERDARLREAFKLAADRGISLLEVTKAELDRRTDGAVHQGLAARIPAYEYAHPSDLLDAGRRARRGAADRGPRLGDRPAQPGCGRAFGVRLRRPRRA